MKVLINTGVVLALLCSIFVFAPSSAEAACTGIDTVPITIDTPGCYTLSGNIQTEGSGITIEADSVELDLGGYGITNTANDNTYDGITINNANNVTVKNGSLLNYYYGVSVSGSTSVRVDSIFIDMKNAGRRGIKINTDSPDIAVSNCRIKGNPTIDDENGITARSSSVNGRFINNEIIDVGGAASTQGGSAFDTTGNATVFDNNKVINSQVLSGIGIRFSGSGIVATRNVVINKEIGMKDYSATGIYRDNLTTGCTTSYDMGSSMINAGNNQ